MLDRTEAREERTTMATGNGDETEGAWALDGVVRDALAGLPGGDPAAELEAVDARWLSAGIRLGLARPDQARVLLELLANRASAEAADAAVEGPHPVADEAEEPEDSDGPPLIPVASALLARAAALPPSEWASLGPDVVFGWVARLKPADVLHLGRVVGEMLAAGSSPDVERGFGLAWTGGVRIPRPELDVMLEEFTDLEITVGRILGGGELGATYRPEARSGLASWFGDWMPRTRPGESQAAGVIERAGAPGRRGLVALWNVWMAMRYRELIPAPMFELLVHPWVTVIGRLPEPA
jgi:hypothetical protein